MSRELPPGWVEATVGELCDINPKHASDTDRSTPVSFVPMPAVSDVHGIILPHSSRPLSEVWTGYTHFQDDDVIFAKITPCMENGKAAVAKGLTNGMACGSTEFYVMRSKGAVRPSYLHSFLRQQGYRNEAEANMTGAVGQRRVPRAFLEVTSIPLPPLPEQHRIVERIEALLAKVQRVRDLIFGKPGVGHNQEQLDRLTQSILAKAFRGELVPQDPADEPASVLLERIRAERVEKPKRSRRGAAE